MNLIKGTGMFERQRGRNKVISLYVDMYFIWSIFYTIKNNTSPSSGLGKSNQILHNDNKLIAILQLDERICLFSIQKR